jgi:hypothetical protein
VGLALEHGTGDVSATIPTSVVDHVMNAPKDTARVAVNRLPGGDPEWPCIAIVVNAAGMAQLLTMMLTAVEHAPDVETKAAWKSLALTTTSAIQGVITS